MQHNGLFGFFLEVCGQYFTNCWGPGRCGPKGSSTNASLGLVLGWGWYRRGILEGFETSSLLRGHSQD